MIIYNPVDGDVYTKNIKFRKNHCFIMSKMGTPLPTEVKNVRRTLDKYLGIKNIKSIDASSYITGKDFLDKIWELILSVPLVSIDYLIRAYQIKNRKIIKDKILYLIDNNEIDSFSKDKINFFLKSY